MKINYKVEDGKFGVFYELEPKEVEILKFVKENEYICFDKQDKFTEKDAECLIAFDFLEMDLESWHFEYNLSSLAKTYLEVNNIH